MDASLLQRKFSPAYKAIRASYTVSDFFLVLCFAITFLCCASAYNIDLPSYVKHEREPNTMFGFSIALHKSGSDYGQTNSLVVGAPRFDTSSYQQGVVQAGAVFKCGMRDGDCNLVRFDSSGNHRNTYGDVIERKSYQWLGATVSASRDSDLIVACAPRYVFHTMTPTKTLRYDPVGTCFTSRNFSQFNEVSPCRTNNWGYHRQGSCQAGFSAATSKYGDRLYIGAPGSWYWQGQAYSISPDATFPYKPPFYQPFGTGGQTYSYDVTRPENQVFSTAESSSQDDDSYLGYSMITGDFNGDRFDDIAIGMPRGAGLLGKVVVNRWNMTNVFNVTGRQIGEYFGYALATNDVDGNGLDDLIIGAPMFSELGNVEGKYDVGRVFIILQSNTDPIRWTTEHIRYGLNTKGRFGLALTTLGDINRDGYGDFAVGAPYDGPEGRGIVYIFHGSTNGPLQKPSQIIKSEDVEGPVPPRTFGFALSGGVDMDGNTYPDMAVGAYASDQVFIFKSRPVAIVNATINFLNPSKLINMEEKNCQTVRDGRVACVDIETCLRFTGEQLPDSLNFDVAWILDVKSTKSPRMFFLRDEGRNIRHQPIHLIKGLTFCRNETVYLADNIRDKLTPLEVEMRYNLTQSRRSRREILEPVIDQNKEIVQRDAINIQKNCGSDNICEPDLRLEINTVDKYLLGSGQNLFIDVLISNMNEDAFEAAFYMVIPADVNFKKIEPIGDIGDTPITPTVPSKDNNFTLKCDIGNPLQSKKVVNFRVILSPSNKVDMAPSFDFFMEVNSTNAEKPGSRFDNVIRKSIGIWVDTELAIEGTSLPDFQLYKASDFKTVQNSTKEDDLGPQVVHIYNIRNNGPSIIEEAVVLIHYPYQTIAGDLLMYMTNQPETDGDIHCDPHVPVNFLNLQLDQNLLRKSYLEQIGAVVRSHGTHTEGSSSIHSSVQIEKSQHGAGGSIQAVAIGRGTKVLSVEEKKRLEKEDEQDVSGDASDVHSLRAQVAAAEARAHSSASYSSSSERTPSVVVSMKNSSVYYDSSGHPHVVERTSQHMQTLNTAPNYISQQRVANFKQDNMYDNDKMYRTSHGQPQQTVAHSTYGNIQIADTAGPQDQRNRETATVYSPNQRYNSPDSAVYKEFDGLNVNLNNDFPKHGQGFQTSTLELGALGRGNVDNELVNRDYHNQHLNVNLNNDFPKRGQSFHTGTLEVNTLGRGNVENELVNRGYHNQHLNVNQHPQSSDITHNYQSSSNYNSDSKPYYGMEKDYFNGKANEQPIRQYHWSQSSSMPHNRYKRENEAEPRQVDLNSPCKAAKCEVLRCVAKNLGKDNGVWIAIRTRMVAKTMEKLASNVPLNISTMAVSYVTRLPVIGQPKDEIIKSHEIFYRAVPEPIPVPDVVPLWVVVLAACAGALILLLLIYLLYKCGFFKRNRPTDHSMERQPLRNGYHGDEHL